MDLKILQDINSKLDWIIQQQQYKDAKGVIADILRSWTSPENRFLLDRICSIILRYKNGDIVLKDDKIKITLDTISEALVNFFASVGIEIVGEIGEVITYREARKRKYEIQLTGSIENYDSLIRVIRYGLKVDAKYVFPVIAEPYKEK